MIASVLLVSAVCSCSNNIVFIPLRDCDDVMLGARIGAVPLMWLKRDCLFTVLLVWLLNVIMVNKMHLNEHFKNCFSVHAEKWGSIDKTNYKSNALLMVYMQWMDFCQKLFKMSDRCIDRDRLTSWVTQHSMVSCGTNWPCYVCFIIRFEVWFIKFYLFKVPLQWLGWIWMDSKDSVGLVAPWMQSSLIGQHWQDFYQQA